MRRRTLTGAVALAAGVGVLIVLISPWRGGEETPDPIVTGPVPTAAGAIPYDPAFPFKQRIPVDPELDERSDAIVERLAANRREGGIFLASRADVPPVYRTTADDPFYSVVVGGERERFRVPAEARAGDGADTPLVLLDRRHPDHGPHTELRLYRARIDHDRRVLSSDGAGLFHYNNDGRRLNPDGTRSLAIPFLGQGTGSGLSILAGLIRPDEVRSGRIRHALRFAYPARDFTDRLRPPAVDTDQPNNATTRDPASAMDMGMRLQLDPAVECERRTVPGRPGTSRETRFLRMICRALQEYGMIAVDGTGDDALIVMMEHSATAGWSELVGSERFDSYSWLVRDEESADDGAERDDRSGIPWSRMRVLKDGAVPPIEP